MHPSAREFFIFPFRALFPPTAFFGPQISLDAGLLLWADGCQPDTLLAALDGFFCTLVSPKAAWRQRGPAKGGDEPWAIVFSSNVARLTARLKHSCRIESIADHPGSPL